MKKVLIFILLLITLILNAKINDNVYLPMSDSIYIGSRTVECMVQYPYTYVVDYNYGLYVINIENPDSIFETVRCSIGSNVMAVYVQDSFAYVADRVNGMYTVNIANPDSIYLVGKYTMTGPCDIVVVDTIAYIASAENGLRIVNVANAFNPIEIGNAPTTSYMYGIMVLDSYAYIANSTSGLTIFDISDLTNPVEIGNYTSINNDNYGIYVKDTIVYIADIAEGIKVFNVSDPTTPILIDSIGVSVHDVLVQDSFLYVGTDNNGVEIFNCSDPANLILRAYNDDFSTINSVYNYEEYVFGTNNSYKFVAFDFTDYPSIIKEKNITNNKNQFAIEKLSDSFTIYYSLDTSSLIEIGIYDINGRTIFKLTTMKNAGKYTDHIEIAKSGLYFIKAKIGNIVYNTKAIIIK